MNAVASIATLLLLLLSASTFVLCEDTLALRCPLNQRRLYRYEALINSFGPPPQNDTENVAEHLYLHSEVGLTCFYSIPKPNKKSLLFWQVDMKNVYLTMEEKSQVDGWKPAKTNIPNGAPKTIGGIPTDQYLDNYFSRFTAFVSTSNGKTVTVIMSKSEPEWVKTMKKGIMSQLQVKLTGSERAEKDEHGEHISHYTKQRLQDGGMLLRKKYSENDMRKSNRAGRMRRRDMRLNSSTDIKIDESGAIESVFKSDNVNFGEDSEKMHKVFDINRSVPFETNNVYESKSLDDAFKAQGVSSLIFETTTESDYEYMNYLVPPNTDEVQALSEAETQAMPNDMIVSHTVLLSDDHQFENLEVSKKYTRKMRRELAKKNVKLDSLLAELEDNPEDAKLSAKVAKYVQTVPSKVTLGKLLSAFQTNRGREDASSEKALSFAKVLQTLLTSSRTKTGQKMLIDNTFDNPELVIHAIFRTLGIKQPIPSIESFLRKLMTYSSVTSDDKTNSHIRLNAYLALADLASRLNSVKAAPIVDIIVQNLNKAKDSNELLLHVHALGNAGSKAPLKLLEKLITRNTEEDIKSAAIQALRKRTTTQEDSAVTKLIHKVVKGNFAPKLKSEAVTVQTEREREMKSGSSVKFFMRHFLDVASERIAKRLDKNAAVSFTTDPQVKSAMLEYFYTVGSKKAGDIVSAAVFFRDPIVLSLLGFSSSSNTTVIERVGPLSDSESLFAQYEDSSDLIHSSMSEFSDSVWDAVSSAARKFGNTIKNVHATHIVLKDETGTLTDGTYAWDTATFYNTDRYKSCVPAGKSQLCMYDTDMMNFIRGQGSLAGMTKNLFYDHERLIGAKKLHVYVGAVGFAGTHFNCKAPPSSFQYSIFARATAKAHIFGYDVHLITGSFENGYQYGVRRDRVYLRVINSVMYDRPLLNEKFTMCDTHTKQIYYKEFPNIFTVSATITISLVPITFSVTAYGKIDLSMQYDYCIDKLSAAGRIIPSFTLGAISEASILWSAGVNLDASLTQKVYPELSVNGLQCKVCAGIYTQSQPNDIIATAFILWRYNYELYRWQMSAAPLKPLSQSCLGM